MKERRAVAVNRDVVLVAMRDDLTLVTLSNQVVGRIAMPAIAGIAAVGDGFWVWTHHALHRLTLDGAIIATHAASVPSGGAPIASPYWATGAWWSGPTSRRYALVDGTLVESEEIGFAIPLEGKSHLSVRGNAVQLQRATSTAWTRRVFERGRVVGGSVMFEGRLAALLVAGDDDHRVIALDLRQGAVGHVLRVSGLVGCAFAPHRGQCVVDTGERLLVLDLRFGNVVHSWDELPASGRELAVDPELRQVVALDADGALEVLDAGGRIASTHAPVATVAVAADPPAPPEPAPPTPSEVEALPTTPPIALWPRRPEVRTSREEAVAILDHQITYVATLAARAIARMWDSGQLSRPQDSHLPFHAEVVGILQVERGRARPELDEAEQRCRIAYERMLEQVRSVGERRAPLTSLADEFGLTPLATQILAVVAAPVLRGELARLYGILANDRARPLVDELAVCQILAGSASRADITRELDRDSPLRRFGLIVASDTAPRPFHALSVDPLVMRRLRDLALDADVEPWLRPVPATRRYDELRMPRAALAAFLAQVHAPRDAQQPLRMVLRGRASSGRRTLVAAIAAAAGRTLGVIDLAHAGGDRIRTAREGLRRTMLRGWVPCVEGFEDIPESDRETREELARVFAEHPGPLAIRLPHGAPPPLSPGYALIELPILPEADRRAAWSAIATRHELSVDADELAGKWRVGVGVIERVCAQVAVEQPADAGAALDALIRQHLHARFGELAQRVSRLATWSDVILPPDVKDSVLELVSRVRHRRRVFEEWGFDRTMTTSRGITALFEGSPGTGKTMVAGVIANELGLDLYRIDLSRIMSKWIGETERNLADAFDAAEDGRAILLFDEADSLFAKRTSVKTSTDRYANLEVNYLLQRLDNFEGFAILTTNFGGAIDPAFRRRLSLKLTFPFPDEEMREQLWRVHLPREAPIAGELDLAGLARRYTMSGGYVRNSVLRAAFLASEEGTALTQQHLERAVALEFREIGKLSASGTLE